MQEISHPPPPRLRRDSVPRHKSEKSAGVTVVCSKCIPAKPFLRSSVARVSGEGGGLANKPRGSSRPSSNNKGVSAVRFRRSKPNAALRLEGAAT